MVLFGATGVGKTDIISAALSGRAEVISADSMQVYRGLDIGTAKPSAALRAAVPHHLIDTLEPNEQYHAGAFVSAADKLVPEIAERGRIPLIAGGTAFYLEAYLFGLPGTPEGDPELREHLVSRYRSEGLDVLRGELREVDPQSESRIGKNDWYRVVRALEVFRVSGRPLSTFTRAWRRRPDSEGATVVGLRRDRDELYERINRRVDEMVEAGLVAEVTALVRRGVPLEAPGMRAIGYREFASLGEPPWTAGEVHRAIELVKRNSRRYAKRQITFFQRLPDVTWIDVDRDDAISRFTEIARVDR